VARIIKTNSDLYEGLIVGVVVVLAVTFAQLRQFHRSGRRLFAGPLGVVAIPCMSLGCAGLALITVGQQAGTVSGLAALGLLVIWKMAEHRRTGRVM
jgi:hypothetical protein